MVRSLRHRGAVLFVAALVAAMVGGSGGTAAASDAAVIVVLQGGADPYTVANEHATAHGAQVSHVYVAALRGYAARVPAQRLAAIQGDPRVAFVSADGEVRALDEVPTGIDRIDAEVSSQAGNTADLTSPAVAVIDTGSGPHPDLNVKGGKNCSTGKSFNDGNGHGTHVAGTIAARNNGTGVVGVLPGAPIYSVRVLNNAGSGSFASVICGVDWVTANAGTLGIKVANMSLGGGGADGGDCATTTEALQKAICNSIAVAGVLYVVAAGNSAADFKDSVPATYDQVLTVTAIADFDGKPGGLGAATCRADQDDTFADFSNFATLASDQAHTIAGPGVCIKSDWLRSGFNTISGTSMATPHVTGTAALCIRSGACAAGLTPDQIAAKLRTDAAARPATYGFLGDPNQPVAGKFFGHLVYAGGY